MSDQPRRLPIVDDSVNADVRPCAACGQLRSWAMFINPEKAHEDTCALCRKGDPKAEDGATRDAMRSRRRFAVRAVTESMARFRRSDLVMLDTGKGDPEIEALRAQRPVTRGDCEGGERPCPWVSCRYHLFLDVDPKTGSIKYNRPDLEPHELTRSCLLDVADEGGVTLNAVADTLNVVRERVRQIEAKSMDRLKKLRTVRQMGEELEKGIEHTFEPSESDGGWLTAAEEKKILIPALAAKFRGGGAPVRHITDRIGESASPFKKGRSPRVFVHKRNRPAPAPGSPRFAEAAVVGTVPPVPGLSEVVDGSVSQGGPESSTAGEKQERGTMPSKTTISEKQQAILDAYNKNPSPGAVAEECGTTSACVSVTISRLRKMGLVTQPPKQGPKGDGPRGLSARKEAILAAFNEGLGFDEIAERIGCSVNAARTAVKILRQRGLASRGPREPSSSAPARVSATKAVADGIERGLGIAVAQKAADLLAKDDDPLVTSLRSRLANIDEERARLNAKASAIVAAIEALGGEVA